MKFLKHVIQIRSPVPHRPRTSVKNHLYGGFFMSFSHFNSSVILVVYDWKIPQ